MEAHDVSASRLGFRDVIVVHLPSPSTHKVWLNMTCGCDSAVMSAMDVTVTAIQDPAHPCRFTQATHTLTLRAGVPQAPSLPRVEYQPGQASAGGGRWVWQPSFPVNQLNWGEVTLLSAPTCRVCSYQPEASSFVVPQREKECQLYFLSFTTPELRWMLLFYMFPRTNTTTTTTTTNPPPSGHWAPSAPSSSSSPHYPLLLPTTDNACPATSSLPSSSPSPPPVTTTTTTTPTTTPTTTTTTTTIPPSRSSSSSSSTVTSSPSSSSPKRVTLLTSSWTRPVTSAHLVTPTTTITPTTTTTTTPTTLTTSSLTPSLVPSSSSARVGDTTTPARSQVTGSSSRKTDLSSTTSVAPRDSDVKRDDEDPNGAESVSVTVLVKVAVAVTVAVGVVGVTGCVGFVCYRRRRHKQQFPSSSPSSSSSSSGQDQDMDMTDLASPPSPHGTCSAAAHASTCVDLPPPSGTSVSALRAEASRPGQRSGHTAAQSTPPHSVPPSSSPPHPVSPTPPPYSPFNGHVPVACCPRHHYPQNSPPPGGHYGGHPHGTVSGHHPACSRHPATAAATAGDYCGGVSVCPRGQPDHPATTGQNYGGVSRSPRGQPQLPATTGQNYSGVSMFLRGQPQLPATTGQNYGRVSMFLRGQPQLPATTGQNYGGVSRSVPHASVDSFVDRSDSFSSVSTVSSEDCSGAAQHSVDPASLSPPPPPPPGTALSAVSPTEDVSWSREPSSSSSSSCCPQCTVRMVLVHCKSDEDRADRLSAWLQQEAGEVVTVNQVVVPQWEHLRQLRHWCYERQEAEKVQVLVCRSPAFRAVLEQGSADSNLWKQFLCEDRGPGDASFMSVPFLDDGVMEKEEGEGEFLSSIVWLEKMLEVSGMPCEDLLHRLLRQLLDVDDFAPPSWVSGDPPSSSALQAGLQHLNAAHEHW